MNLSLNNNNKNYHSNDDFLNEIRNFLNKHNIQNNNELTTYYSIDRFINDFAVCENKTTGEFINIPRKLIVSSAKVGDIIYRKNNKFIIDINQTRKEQEEIKSLVTSLFKRKNS